MFGVVRVSMKQPKDNSDRLRKGDDVIADLGFTVLTKNEAHAIELGLSGLVVGLGYGVGYTEGAIAVSILLILIAFGVKGVPDETDGDKPIAVKTARHEPWWFIVSYVIMFTIAVVSTKLPV